MPKLDLRTASGQQPPIEIGQVDIGLTDGETEPMQLVLTNRDTLSLTEVRISVEGEGADAIQLAADHEGRVGGWHDNEVIARLGVLPPNRSCSFWVRAVPKDDLDVGDQSFEFVVKSIAIIP